MRYYRQKNKSWEQPFSRNELYKTYMGREPSKVRILVDGKPKRVYVSARALKSGKVERV